MCVLLVGRQFQGYSCKSHPCKGWALSSEIREQGEGVLLCGVRAWGSDSSPLLGACMALATKPTSPQSCQELLPEAGADATSSGARTQCSSAAADGGCSLGCHGDLQHP